MLIDIVVSKADVIVEARTGGQLRDDEYWDSGRKRRLDKHLSRTNHSNCVLCFLTHYTILQFNKLEYGTCMHRLSVGIGRQLQAVHELIYGSIHLGGGLIVWAVPSVQVDPLCRGEQRLDAVGCLGPYPGILFQYGTQYC